MNSRVKSIFLTKCHINPTQHKFDMLMYVNNPEIMFMQILDSISLTLIRSLPSYKWVTHRSHMINQIYIF